MILSDPNVQHGGLTKEEIIKDFRICCISREASLMSRKEVLTGKAKFGISGEGKEVPLVAMAKAFRKGDFRSGYYRDQTFLLALDLMTLEDFFAQLYADTENDRLSGGRQMSGHFSTPLLDEQGQWLDHLAQYNISADISSTAGQMSRALGLALASAKYKANEHLQDTTFSKKGQEVSFVTIGDASTSEGVFWESLNAAAVQQVPLATFVWDDGYGISVPKKYQTTKASISEALMGFDSELDGEGMNIYQSKGWDYIDLVETFRKGIEKVRFTHKPALFHVDELTQPQGHSTSGSHERYKSKERLQWEKEHDCILMMKNWMVQEGIATEEDLTAIQKEAKVFAKAARDRAWKNFNAPSQALLQELNAFYDQLPAEDTAITALRSELKMHINPLIHEIVKNARNLFYYLRRNNIALASELNSWIAALQHKYSNVYGAHLYSETEESALRVAGKPAVYNEDSPSLNGYQILNAFFDASMEKHPELYAFGEDVGQIGGVNQSFSKLQEKYGKDRIFDTGIRELTIMGQAVGMSMRGLRPIAEIQYLDYLIYGLQPLVDDLSTVRWRSVGRQKAPAIIRTRGHRLEGVWHSGSPMGMIVNSIRGMHVCTPRNMVQAVGMYNTLLESDEPGIVIECLNGYRLKERLPANMGEYNVPLGVPEVLVEGTDITMVTYGSCVRLAEAACKVLAEQGISVELVDVQTLLPFDLEERITASIKKTNRLIVVDEDVPGGASAYILQQLVEKQNAYRYLDSAPTTLTAKAHRPAYGSDGDYFSKPSPEDMVDAVYEIMKEADPQQFV